MNSDQRPILPARTATIERSTRETRISATLVLDRSGTTELHTGIGMLDHLLTALVLHAGFDCTLKCEGDLHVDDHHTAEDCGIVLGQLLDAALGDRAGITRYGMAMAPLDEALARTVVDLCTRPFFAGDLRLGSGTIGGLSCQNVAHVLSSMAVSARITLHVDVLKGVNDHHMAEAAFKSCALALREAVARSPSAAAAVRSTKGVL